MELQDCAVLVSPEDNVAVVRRDLPSGTAVTLPDGGAVTVTKNVGAGHRFAVAPIATGEFVRQYGQPIGTSRGIAAGEPVTHDNMSDEVPVVRDVPAGLEAPEPDYLAREAVPVFQGFKRPDGRVGTRNWVLIVPTSMCASHEAQQIAMRAELAAWDRERFPNVDGVVAIPHNKGCGCPDGANVEVVLRTLGNYADHPNVGGVVFIDLGCEKTNTSLLAQYLKDRGGLRSAKPVAWIGIQSSGGTQAAVHRGVREVERMLATVNETRREPVPASEITLGVQCGGSDGFSGLSANPSLGFAADLVVRSGGRVILSEVPEFCGAEHVLAQRARDAEVAREVYGMVDWYKGHASKWGASLGENPSPGNIAGGLLNITIKSLGAIAKGGTTRVEGVTGYAEPFERRGLHLMQGPGYDQESVPGIVAAGANVLVFTTGRGTTIGNAICPVIKLASNTAIFERMPHDIDLNAGSVIDGTETIPQVGRRVFERVCAVAGGELSFAESNLHREFQIWAAEPVSL